MVLRAKIKQLDSPRGIRRLFAKVVGRRAVGQKFELVEEYRYQTNIRHTVAIVYPQYIDGRMWEVCLTTLGALIIKPGFKFDGCSFLTLDDTSNATGCLVHDALYRLIKSKLLPKRYRREADRILRRIMKAHGAWGFRRAMYYNAVRLGGWVAVL